MESNPATNSDDDVRVVLSEMDYEKAMREILTRISDEADVLHAQGIDTTNLSNLIKVANDYMFYLEDNRRVIL